MKAATKENAPRTQPRKISIHAAREGGDIYPFLHNVQYAISIHAAREGGDMDDDAVKAANTDFNPRRP